MSRRRITPPGGTPCRFSSVAISLVAGSNGETSVGWSTIDQASPPDLGDCPRGAEDDDDRDRRPPLEQVRVRNAGDPGHRHDAGDEERAREQLEPPRRRGGAPTRHVEPDAQEREREQQQCQRSLGRRTREHIAVIGTTQPRRWQAELRRHQSQPGGEAHDRLDVPAHEVVPKPGEVPRRAGELLDDDR